MYRILYSIPFWNLCIGLLIFCNIWVWARKHLVQTNVWRWIHFFLIFLWAGVCLYFTIFSRSAGNGQVMLMPFWSYRIAFLEGSYDYFQQIYLNVLLFFFFGLFAPEVSKQKGRYLVIITGSILFSTIIECCQFWLDIGMAEFDDVFSNTLGTIFGALVNWMAEKYAIRSLVEKSDE